MSKKTNEQISYNMSCVKSKDTKIEIMLRKELCNRGIRYRKNAKDVFGHPDIVFKGRKIAVFCDSEFWHGYNWADRQKDFKSNQDFWVNKIEKNINRDKLVSEKLISEGWNVLRFWGKEITGKLSECADKIEELLKNEI